MSPQTSEFLARAASSTQLAEDDALRLCQHYEDLEAALAADLPVYRNIMGTIHAILVRDPAVVTILAPEQRALLIKAMGKAHGVWVTEKAAKAKKPSKAQILSEI